MKALWVPNKTHLLPELRRPQMKSNSLDFIERWPRPRGKWNHLHSVPGLESGEELGEDPHSPPSGSSLPSLVTGIEQSSNLVQTWDKPSYPCTHVSHVTQQLNFSSKQKAPVSTPFLSTQVQPSTPLSLDEYGKKVGNSYPQAVRGGEGKSSLSRGIFW